MSFLEPRRVASRRSSQPLEGAYPHQWVDAKHVKVRDRGGMVFKVRITHSCAISYAGISVADASKIIARIRVDRRTGRHVVAQAAFPRMSANGVRSKMLASRVGLLARAYSTSRSSMPMKPISLRPLTCHRPVRPGRTEKRS